MSAEERLDQVELVLAQLLAQTDRNTAQLNQLRNAVANLATLGAQQSDNIQFLLREVAELRQEQVAAKGRDAAMDGKLDLILSLLQGPK